MNALAGFVLELLMGVLMKAGYMRTQNAFPQPLTRDEEARQLSLLAEGDDDQRHRAFDVLVERNLRLVAHVVKKFSDTGEDPEDLVSIGTIGLIKGVQTFDPGRGTRLATYAARCVENEISMTGSVREILAATAAVAAVSPPDILRPASSSRGPS